MPLSEWELWACANSVLTRYGDAAPRHVAERIDALAVQRDEAGVRTWQAIAARLEQTYIFI